MEELSFENRVTTISDAVKKASLRDSSTGIPRTDKGDALDLLVDAVEDLLRRSRQSLTALQSADEAMTKLQIASAKKTENEPSREHILLLEALQENIPDTIYFKDLQGRFLHLSKAHARAFNLIPTTEVVGMTDFDFFTDEHAREAFEGEQRIIRTGEPIIDKEEKETWLDRPATWVLTTKMPLRDQQGNIVGTFGISRDITERKRAEQESLAHVRLLESLDQVNRAIQGANDLEQLMSDVLDTLLLIFECDRAWLVYPCDLKAASWRAPMERTRPEYPGALAQGLEVPMDSEVLQVFRTVRTADGPVPFGPGLEHPLPKGTTEQFGIQSMLSMAIYPKADKPYLFGLHQCSYPRIWTAEEKRLFQEVGRRLADALSSHLAHRGLRESENRYRRIIEGLTDYQYSVRVENGRGVQTTQSSACATVTGYTPEEFAADPYLWFRMVAPEDRELVQERVQQILAGKDIPPLEHRILRKDGAVRWVRDTTILLKDAFGRLVSYDGVIKDITERKRAEDKLALERSLLTALMENIPDNIYFKDAESRFIRNSRAHVKMFGLNDTSKLIGKTDMDFFSEKHARQAYEDEQRIIRTGEPIVNVEEKETWPNRPDTWALTTKMPLRDQDGNIIGTFGISHDITKRKQAEERILSLARFVDENPHPVMRVTPDGSVIYANKASEPLTSFWAGGVEKISGEYLHAVTLAWETGQKKEIEVREASRTYEIAIVPFADAGYINLYGRNVTEEKTLAERLNQAQRMEAIGQLTGGIAHDFNNVLQAITGYCELLRQRLSEKDQTYLAEITKAAYRAAALTAQLLAYSRKQILRPQVVETKVLIRSIQKMLERVIGDDIELRTFIDPNTGNFLADPGQMEQVLLNLAVNARDAMPTGGKVTIESSNRTFDEAYVRDHPGANIGQYVRIAVSDTGVGMDQETLSHIYEPFFTTKEKGKGTGLGLSTVYGIVKQSDGYINCYSEMGKGTTFTIYLSMTLEEADKPVAAAPGKTAPRGTETVLLVDDDSMVRSVARIALEEAGYVVIEAAGGEEALSDVTARSLSVALLVTDVVMPRMSGKELAQKLEKICPGVRVLYASGYTANVISHHGILEAGVDFLQKPFSSVEFLTKVREILDRP